MLQATAASVRSYVASASSSSSGLAFGVFSRGLVEVSSLERNGTMTTYFVFRAILFSVILGVCATGHSQPRVTPDPSQRSFTFALIGDLAYRPEQEPWLEHLLTELQQTPLAFVVHVGDLGTPSLGSCTNEFWARRLAQFQASVKESPPQAAGLLRTKPIQTRTTVRRRSSPGDAVGCIGESLPPSPCHPLFEQNSHLPTVPHPTDAA